MPPDSYVATSNSHISMIRIYSINAITTQDDGMFRSLKEWVQSLKKILNKLRKRRDPSYTMVL